MAISVNDIKTLRERTSAGIMDCRQALTQAHGDMERAVALLREKGLATAAKRADREARNGVVEAYVHGGRIGVLLELSCETDFVARTDVFHTLAHEIALQIASMHPQVVATEDIPADADGRPEELALLAQPFIRDSKRTVEDRINETIASTGEKIAVRRFVRYALGE